MWGIFIYLVSLGPAGVLITWSVRTTARVMLLPRLTHGLPVGCAHATSTVQLFNE